MKSPMRKQGQLEMEPGVKGRGHGSEHEQEGEGGILTFFGTPLAASYPQLPFLGSNPPEDRLSISGGAWISASWDPTGSLPTHTGSMEEPNDTATQAA